MIDFEFFSKLNPQFVLGQSNSNYSDCCGLVIFYLREKGFSCDWEPIIPRVPTKITEFKRLLGDCGFTKIESPTKSCFCIWTPHLNYAHIGIYNRQDNCVYHITPFGLRVEVINNLEFFSYQGL